MEQKYKKLLPHREFLITLRSQNPEMIIKEIAQHLFEKKGITTNVSTLGHFFKREVDEAEWNPSGKGYREPAYKKLLPHREFLITLRSQNPKITKKEIAQHLFEKKGVTASFMIIGFFLEERLMMQNGTLRNERRKSHVERKKRN